MSRSSRYDEEYKRMADLNRTSRQMLADMREDTWGWVVYRTTYSSDPAFYRAINLLTSWVKDGVYRDLRDRGVENGDPTPNDQVWARHKLTVIEDVFTLDRASIDAIRARFEAWVHAQGKRDAWPKYRACVIMDEAAMQRLNETAMSPEEYLEKYRRYSAKELRQWFVPVVEAFPEPDMGEPGYEGWMNCSVSGLIRLWMSMGDGMYMGEAFGETRNGVY